MKTRNRVVPALVLAFAFEAAATTALLPFVVVWAHDRVGLVGVAAGLLFVGQALGEFGAGVAGGGLADRVGRRRVLVIASAGTAAAYGALTVTDVSWAAIVLFLLAGVFESAFHPTVAAIVGDVTPEEQLPHAFGLLTVGSNLGRIAGPLLGALVVLVDLDAVFALSAGLLLLAVVLEVAAVPRDAPGRAAEGDDEPEIPPGTLRALRADRALAGLVTAGGLLAVAGTWFEADGLVALRTQTAVGTTGFASLFTIAALVTIAAQVPITRLTARTAPGRLLLVGGLLQGTGLAALIAAPAGYTVLVVAVVISAVGAMLYGPTVSTLVTRRAPMHQRASYQAALSISQDVGTALGPISGLALLRVATAAGLWSVAAGASVISGLLGRAAVARPTAEISDPPVSTAR
ncbi:MFS transporter [Jatrophihabitans sp. YIM 134969]